MHVNSSARTPSGPRVKNISMACRQIEISTCHAPLTRLNMLMTSLSGGTVSSALERQSPLGGHISRLEILFFCDSFRLCG